ncbi:MAG: pilus assembly protein PilM [Chloroflexi bacterium]|nr:pilus assembly protein PilM [Chloroflexota bacterium]
MSNSIVTLYIDDGSIRLLVTRGKTIKKYANVLLEPGMVEGALVLNEDEVAERVKQLLKSQKVHAKKVVVGLSGLNCLTRPITFPQLPRAMLPEAVMREAKRVLPLDIEQFYVTWHPVPAPKGKTRVFLSAVRCQCADAWLKTLRKAGLKPTILDLKPLALARLVKETSAAIVDVQPSEFDIVIMMDGVPQPIRTVPLPGDVHSWEEKFAIIKADLDRTIKFFNTNNPENLLSPGTPIYVSGELAGQHELLEALSNELGFPVAQLAPPLKCARDIDYNYYMVNIGLAVRRESPNGKIAGPSVATANLLPMAYRPKPISWGRVAALPAGLAIIGALIPLLILTQSTSANILSVRSQLDATNQQLELKNKQRQQLNKDIARLEKELVTAQTSRDTILKTLGNLEQRHVQLDKNLEIIMEMLPAGVTLKSINQTSKALALGGVTKNREEILSYAQNLADSEGFSEVTIARIAGGGLKDFEFTLNLKTKD